MYLYIYGYLGVYPLPKVLGPNKFLTICNPHTRKICYQSSDSHPVCEVVQTPGITVGVQ